MSWAEVQVIKDKISSMGYPPKAMSSYNVQAASGGKVKLYFTPPPNTYIKDQEEKAVPLVQIGGIMIRKKAGSRITSLTDGELLENIPAEDMFNYTITPYIDEDVDIGTKYFYRFFPYSTVGMYNTQDDNQYGVTVTEEGSMLVFGFDQDFRDLNPDTQISYPDDVENHSYAPMVVLGDETERTCGGWRYFLEGVLHNAPYMVKRNGEADYELDHINYKYKINGEASDWDNRDYQGMAMAWINRMYKKEWYTEEGEVRHVRFCEGVPIDEDPADWIPVGCFTNDEPDENVKRGFFIPIGTHGFGTTSATKLPDGYNNLVENVDYSKKTAHAQIYQKQYFYAIVEANNFIGNYNNEDGAFSTVFCGPVLDLMYDYLQMLFRTTNLDVVLGKDTEQTANIEAGDTITPGFYLNSGNRVLYSHMLYKGSNSIINPYFLERFLVRASSYSRMDVDSHWSTAYSGAIGLNQQILRTYVNYWNIHHLNEYNGYLYPGKVVNFKNGLPFKVATQMNCSSYQSGNMSINFFITTQTGNGNKGATTVKEPTNSIIYNDIFNRFLFKIGNPSYNQYPCIFVSCFPGDSWRSNVNDSWYSGNIVNTLITNTKYQVYGNKISTYANPNIPYIVDGEGSSSTGICKTISKLNYNVADWRANANLGTNANCDNPGGYRVADAKIATYAQLYMTYNIISRTLEGGGGFAFKDYNIATTKPSENSQAEFSGANYYPRDYAGDAFAIMVFPENDYVPYELD